MDLGGERPSTRTQLTDRANAMVWKLPLPRRGRVLLSQVVYRNPDICSGRVVEALRALEAAEIETVLIGGWGIDALAGHQLRSHADLDLLADERDFERAAEVLGSLGYRPWNQIAPGPIGELGGFTAAQTFRDGALRVVELHAVDLRQIESATGMIADQPVTCLSPDQQLQAQRLVGRTWTPNQRRKHRRNLAALLSVLRTGM